MPSSFLAELASVCMCVFFFIFHYLCLLLHVTFVADSKPIDQIEEFDYLRFQLTLKAKPKSRKAKMSIKAIILKPKTLMNRMLLSA